jgi:hypothetical protein
MDARGPDLEESSMRTPLHCAALLIGVILSWYVLPATLEAG